MATTDRMSPAAELARRTTGSMSRSRNPASSMMAAKLKRGEDQPDRRQHRGHAAPAEEAVDRGVPAGRFEPAAHGGVHRLDARAKPAGVTTHERIDESGWVMQANTPVPSATRKIVRYGGTFRMVRMTRATMGSRLSGLIQKVSAMRRAASTLVGSASTSAVSPIPR